jgi:hypothetical protein
VTHIDGELIDHPNIKKYSSIKQMYVEKLFVRTCFSKYRFIKYQFDKQIEHLMKTGKIADKYDIISRFMYINTAEIFYDETLIIFEQIIKDNYKNKESLLISLRSIKMKIKSAWSEKFIKIKYINILYMLLKLDIHIFN